ncbi:MAG TPA: DUF1236 domain-containing protein [Hyphomicrobiaceae bacterium]|nr:DUF1236 domain-containing protein [Hyphomicrobiaceae bacterium]
MRNLTTMTSAAALLLLCSGPMAVQAQQKGPEPGGPSQAQQGGQQGAPAGKAESRGDEGGKAQSGKQQQAEPKGKDAGDTGKRQAQEPKQQPKQQQAEPKGKDAGDAGKSQGQDSKQQPTQKQAEPKDKDAGKATKSQAQDSKQQPTQQQAEPKSKDTGTTTKGQAQDTNQQRTQQQAQPSGKATTQGQRVQISQEQRTNIRQTILSSGQVNRVQNVNVRVNVGSRIPSGIRLAPLPPTVISLVPEYRSYHYFVVEEEIYIVEPSTQVVVEVIHVSGPDRGGSQSTALTLSQEERRILVRAIEIRRDSTLGLGALEIGARVPRGVELVEFPAIVVEEVPKLRGYHYFTAENAIVIVEPSRDRIALVVEAR